MTGHGGWPMTVFLTPDGVPFYGGTYFPKDDRHGMPSFTRILRTLVRRVSRTPGRHRAHGGVGARDVRCAATRRRAAPGRCRRDCSTRISRARRRVRRTNSAASAARRSFRRRWRSIFSSRYWARRGIGTSARDRASTRFMSMARGGIYDQVGGGFARYSVDAEWLVPHFEKMLYDNALLARLGAHLWQATGDTHSRRVVEETIDWAIARDAIARRRILLVARRRQRRARGQVLRLERRRVRRRARRRCADHARVLGRDRRRQLRGAQHSVPSRDGRAARSRRGTA